MTRFEVIQQIETFGVVAVIRLQDPARLRAVVDAIAAGGVRALEVTMTVPRAVEMIAEIAPTLPNGFLIRRRHRPRQGHGEQASSTPAPNSSSARCFAKS